MTRNWTARHSWMSFSPFIVASLQVWSSPEAKHNKYVSVNMSVLHQCKRKRLSAGAVWDGGARLQVRRNVFFMLAGVLEHRGEGMLGQTLRAEEWVMLIDIAEGQAGPWGAAACGLLLMRGLVRVSDEGRIGVTQRGLDVLAERADSLMGCVEGLCEEAELERLSVVLEGREPA